MTIEPTIPMGTTDKCNEERPKREPSTNQAAKNVSDASSEPMA
jgi:hypothetical protein